jgi:hypothetical protein
MISPEEGRINLASNPKSGYSNIDVENVPKPLDFEENNNIAQDSEHWITLENGEHALVDGDGQVLSGAGGNLNYKYLPNVKSKSGDVNNTDIAPEAKKVKENEKISTTNRREVSGTNEKLSSKREGDNNWQSGIINNAENRNESEIHELTKEQYFNDVERVKNDVGKTKKIETAFYEYTDPSGAGPFKGKTEIKNNEKRGDIISAPFGNAKIVKISKKEIELDNLEVYERAKKYHRESIEKAIKEGKTIPDNVLNDYPDLKANNLSSTEQH